MIRDRHRFASALARLQAYLPNLPQQFSDLHIKQYHDLVSEIEAATGFNLNDFKIPADRMRKKVKGSRPTSYHADTPPQIIYSDQKYCDPEFAKQQIFGLSNYLKTMQDPQKFPSTDDKDYWSMTDIELERLARRYNIKPWGRSGEQGEHWYVDRTHIIDELVKRDRALSQTPQQPANVIHVDQMHGSVIQQGNQAATATINFQTNDAQLRAFLNKLKEQAPNISLTDSARQQLKVDIETINIQLTSSHPKNSIITETLHSIRAILESAAGSMIAPGLVFEILKLLGQ